jgi:transposase-like protein
MNKLPDKDLSEPERAELERLRKENARLRMERDFAKKVIMPAGAGTLAG